MSFDRERFGPKKPTASNRSKSTPKARRKPSHMPWQTCTREEIKKYRKFRKLYGERKFAQSYSKEKQILSFTDDLPTEIRLMVYKHHFQTPDYFELWAPWDLTRQDSRWQNQFKTYASTKKALKIMRLSKKIRQEAADYFYGQHNFRFSTSNGFVSMAVFSHTVGQINCDFIKHITVQLPNPESSICNQRARACLSQIWVWRSFEKIHHRRGMRVPVFESRMEHYGQSRARGESRYEKYEKAVLTGFRQLRNMASLKSLEILIPWNYLLIETCHLCTAPICRLGDMQRLGPRDLVRHCVEGHCSDPEYWAMLADLKQQTASESLSISLVLAHEPSDDTYPASAKRLFKR